MRAYADTSFLVKLLGEEEGTPEAVAEYRRLDRPPLFFLPIHALEVGNAIRQRSFHRLRSEPKTRRAAILRERDVALARLERFQQRGILLDVAVDLDQAMQRAVKLSVQHTERLGCRGFDLLHVALALELGCEVFLTGDIVHGRLATAEGMTVCTIGAQ